MGLEATSVVRSCSFFHGGPETSVCGQEVTKQLAGRPKTLNPPGNPLPCGDLSEFEFWGPPTSPPMKTPEGPSRGGACGLGVRHLESRNGKLQDARCLRPHTTLRRPEPIAPPARTLKLQVEPELRPATKGRIPQLRTCPRDRLRSLLAKVG